MKKYYSPVKEYETRKRPHPFYKVARAFVKLFFPKNEFRYEGERPEPGAVYVCNHTRLYAPTYFVAKHPEKVRVWGNNYFLFTKRCFAHLKNKVLKDNKNRWILLPLGCLLSPFIAALFRAIEPVPVYHKCEEVYTMTFRKSLETLEAGISQVIFPERTENRVNRYVYQFNHGFPELGKLYYERTGKRLKFYPVYCAPELRTLAVGNPVEYDPDVDVMQQRDEICVYLENEIARLGDSLPPHTPTAYV